MTRVVRGSPDQPRRAPCSIGPAVAQLAQPRCPECRAASLLRHGPHVVGGTEQRAEKIRKATNANMLFVLDLLHFVEDRLRQMDPVGPRRSRHAADCPARGNAPSTLPRGLMPVRSNTNRSCICTCRPRRR